MRNIEKIVIMGGAGHIGLPLGLLLADVGFRVCLYDPNDVALKTISEGSIPFREEGAEPLLRRLLPTGRLSFSAEPSCISDSDAIISVIGTPVDEHLSPTLMEFLAKMKSIFDYLREGQLLILRSTVSPGTCAALWKQLQASEKRVRLAFCPERIIEGRAMEEIPRLPQIISGMTPEAVEGARQVFGKLSPEIVELSPGEAELSKLFVNAWRYLKFAIANQFYMIANDLGSDFDRILHSIRYNYPRGRDLPDPGLSAGPCLLKDTMQLATAYHSGFHLGHAAMIINEGLPNYMVRTLSSEHELHKMTVGILGMAFKAESDDIRESLSYKLRKLLIAEGATVICADPYVSDSKLVEADELVRQADLIIVAAPHRVFANLDTKGKPVVDIWNLYGEGRKI